MLIVSSPETWCGGASSNRAPSSIPVGYASHTGYQKLSISRVAGQREPAPPSKFSNEGGLRNRVFRGIVGFLYFSIRTGFFRALTRCCCRFPTSVGHDLND